MYTLWWSSLKASHRQEKYMDNNHTHHATTDKQDVRHHIIETLRTAGIEPWPSTQPTNARCQDILDEWKEHAESRIYMLAGRIMAFRAHGKTVFATVQDSSGTVQVYVRKDDVGDVQFEQWNTHITIGDIIWVSGTSFKTKTGEITLRVSSYALLSKCLRPLPDKFHGISNIELKYRHRYLDLITDATSRERFYKRSLLVRTMRSFFDAHEFLEVETPMLHPIPGGATAKPFVTHHNALDMELYLRIAPELYLKRLIVGGFERIYEINRNFRNEGISTRHNPEFTMVEFYVAYRDHYFMMDFIESMIRTIVMNVCGVFCIPYGDSIIDFEQPFARMTMREAVAKQCNCSIADLEGDGINTIISQFGIHIKHQHADWGEKLYALFEHCVERTLQTPTFITEFPVSVSPLSKKNPKNPLYADRFEFFVAGMELANGFDELNDPEDQAERFRQQAAARQAGDAEAHYYDEEYITALEYGLPPTVGAGIGIDRFTMLLTNASSIKDVILFPTLRRETEVHCSLGK
jgi:lysyl-tRNA synthetase, class II